MASYFDIPPARSKASAAPTAGLDVPESSGFGKMSLLSPQISAILDDLELEDKSSSDEDKASLSGHSISSDQDAINDLKSRPGKPSRDQSARKVQASTAKSTKKAPTAAPPRLLGSQKHPHLARFHSLRSMLFQSNIEANMHKAKQTGATEDEWKAQHEQRQGLNRPKTPDSPPKQGFAHKLGNSLRRLTSKDVPTMKSINEVGDDNESTASDDEEDGRRRAEDSEEIDHSDIEDIVRWVSRRDPPSDGETARAPAGVKDTGKEDSGHESFGNSDVDDLVRWVSRREPESSKTQKPVIAPKNEVQGRGGESDISTQSDSGDDPMDEDDMDDLVRWVSRREGPNAGPIRENKGTTSLEPSKRVDDESDKDDELERWRLLQDDMSGESDVPDDLPPQTGKETAQTKPSKHASGSNLKTEVVSPSARESNAGLEENDVDELVRWVSRKKSAQN